jgi:tetratricopeptide (TPR) repeat protein
MKRITHSITILFVVNLIFSCSNDIQSIESLYQAQKYEQVISDINGYLFFHVTDIKALHMRARSYEEIGDTTRSKKDYQRIISIDDTYAQGYLGLGKLLFEEKNYAQAELLLLRAATLDATDFDIYYLLGRTQLMNQQFRSAEIWLRKASEIKPEEAKTYYYTAMSLAYQGDALGSAAAFNSYLNYEPNSQIGRYNRGFALMSVGYLTWAIEDFDYVLSKNPNHLGALARKGVCLVNQGKIEGCHLLQQAAKQGSEYAKSRLEICG